MLNFLCTALSDGREKARRSGPPVQRRSDKSTAAVLCVISRIFVVARHGHFAARAGHRGRLCGGVPPDVAVPSGDEVRTVFLVEGDLQHLAVLAGSQAPRRWTGSSRRAPRRPPGAPPWTPASAPMRWCASAARRSGSRGRCSPPDPAKRRRFFVPRWMRRPIHGRGLSSLPASHPHFPDGER